MRLSSINTKRGFEHRFFYDLVFEWEDAISATLGIPLYYEYSPYLMYRKMRNKYLRKLPILRDFLYPSGISLCFDMNPVDEPRFNSKHIIPWIIDFYLPEERLPYFNEAYKEHPVVLISCLDAFFFLKEHNDLCPDIKIAYLPLSLPDQYALFSVADCKKYDVALVGNQDDQMKLYFDKYVLNHPHISYVYRNNRNGDFSYYTNNCDKPISGGSRKDYINILRSSRVTLYATSMLYGNIKGGKNFNHVTPRFLEYLAAGCHVLCRYIPNADTEFFELEKFCPPINTYEQFERLLDEALSKPIDSEFYARYLKMHFTSVRAKQLEEILSKL